MSDPDKAAAQTKGMFEETPKSENTEVSFEDKVNEAIGAMKQGEDGLWTVPEDLPDEVAYAAKLEKRRRDTQSALSKTQQELKVSQTEREELRQRLATEVPLDLSEEEREELDELKNEDPDAWRAKLNEYEERAVTKRKEELDELSEATSEEIEIARRADVLTNFLDANPELVLNDEVMENDLPPGITGKLEKGEISFEEFLDEAKEFLTLGRVIKGTEAEDDEPNLGKGAGGTSVQEATVEKDTLESYKDTVF